jgi:hypothetical protein
MMADMEKSWEEKLADNKKRQEENDKVQAEQD